MQPHECRPSKYQFGWNTEQNAGFAGGLPWVRIGKRCIIGLGFFGCALGKLPEANGKLFDDMSDPNRPRSSVPGPDDYR